MTLTARLNQGTPAIIAILRGIHPDQVVDIGHALLDAGIHIMEVPLNSPRPLASIERLALALGERALIGAGTVVSVDAIDSVTAAGARMIVAPNTDLQIIARTLARGLELLPGAMTPTEAFAAASAGAQHLKIFPAISGGPAHLRAMREVLPADRKLWAVGGVDLSNIHQWITAGVAGVGIGGSLYRPGVSPESVRDRAAQLVALWRKHTTEHEP